MELKKMLKFTKILFFLSISLSIFSYLNKINEQSEIYPFFYQELHSQPLGSDNLYSNYRLYGIANNQETVSISNYDFQHFSKDDNYYLPKDLTIIQTLKLD